MWKPGTKLYRGYVCAYFTYLFFVFFFMEIACSKAKTIGPAIVCFIVYRICYIHGALVITMYTDIATREFRIVKYVCI